MINPFFLKETDPTSSQLIKVSFPLIEPLISHMYFHFYILLYYRNDNSSLGQTARKVLLLLLAFPLSDVTEYLTLYTRVITQLLDNLLESIHLFDSSSKQQTSIESPEEILNQRIMFISEILSLCQSTCEYKNDQEKAMIFYQTFLQEITTILLKGYFEVNLLHIQYKLCILLFYSIEIHVLFHQHVYCDFSSLF